MTFKNIRVKIGKKPTKGPDTRKSRLQRVKVLASGKYKFVKNVGKKLSRKKSSGSSNPKKRSVRRIARRRRKRGGGGKSLSRSLMKLARAGALVAPAAFTLAEKGFNANGLKWVTLRYTGVDSTGKFQGSKLLEGWGPFIAVSAVTYAIPKLLGIIRRI